MGNLDRNIRLVVSVAIVALYFADLLFGWVAFALMAVAVLSVVTSVERVCLLYIPFGISTYKPS